eukprot:3570490-Pleurochrysis_carterae.AAC.1
MKEAGWGERVGGEFNSAYVREGWGVSAAECGERAEGVRVPRGQGLPKRFRGSIAGCRRRWHRRAEGGSAQRFRADTTLPSEVRGTLGPRRGRLSARMRSPVRVRAPLAGACACATR